MSCYLKLIMHKLRRFNDAIMIHRLKKGKVY